MLLDRLRDRVGNWCGLLGNVNAATPEDFDAALAKAIADFAEKPDAWEGENIGEQATTYVGRMLAKNAGAARQYRRLHRFSEAVTNEIKIQAMADLCDRLRFLLFRFLTAVMIAAVVLATGFLAREWNIPLPMLRLPG